MGLNIRSIQPHLLRMLQVSAEKTYTSMKKHPRVSCALLALLILYICLSFIFNLLIFLSPFLVCTAILVKIFWSSEQKHTTCVKKIEEEKKFVEAENPNRNPIPNPPKVIKNERRGMLYKYPSQNATSRRRNFTGRKLDVYGDLEHKAKDLSSVFRNEFTKKNTDIGGLTYLEKEIGSLGYKLPARKPEVPIKQSMFSEPSMKDLVTCGARNDKQERKIEDEKKAQEDTTTIITPITTTTTLPPINTTNKNKKVVELKEDNNEQKNQMELKIGGIESNKRLESLIARRRARKQLRLQIENGLIDIESISPSQISPLFVSRMNSFDSPRSFDGLETPGSAPSGMRSPFDIPYDPLEEKPNLKGDSFDREFIDDLKLESRHDLELKEHRFNQRVRRLSGMGNNARAEQLFSREGNETVQALLSPVKEGEETSQEEEKFNIDMVGMNVEEMDNVDPTNSMLDINASEPNDDIVDFPIPPPMLYNGILGDFPISSSASVTDINDSLYEALSTPMAKKMDSMSLQNGNIHTPSLSLASDLQVEFSEIGSPTLTVDESHDTLTTTDGEYDGDVDRDINSGSEDMWGASLHTREVRGISEHDLLESSNWRDIANVSSPLQNIDEENAADVSSMSSRSDNLLEDTPTHAMSTSDHSNIFGNGRETGGSQTSQYSSDVLARWKRLMTLMDTRVNNLPQEMVSEKPEQENNQTDTLTNKQQVIHDVENSTGTEQEHTEDLRSNEEPGALLVPQETADELSTNSSSSSSPRSVLPISLKTVADQEIGVEQSDIEDAAQETVNGDSMPQNIQPLMDDPNVESHNTDFGHSQEGTYHLENSIQESNREDQTLNNDENKFTPPSRHDDASTEPHKLAENMNSEDMNDKSIEPYDNKVPRLETSSETHIENEEKSQTSVTQESSTEPFTNAEASDTSSATDFEGKHNDLNHKEAILSSYMSEGENEKLSENRSSKEVNDLKSEAKEEVQEEMEWELLDHNGEISEDSQLPMVTKVTNTEESDKINKNEATDQELHKNNETMALTKPEGDSDVVSNKVDIDDS